MDRLKEDSSASSSGDEHLSNNDEETLQLSKTEAEPDRGRKRSVAMFSQKKLGPLDRKRQSNLPRRSSRRGMSIKAKDMEAKILNESKGKYDIAEKRDTNDNNEEQQGGWGFSWKKIQSHVPTEVPGDVALVTVNFAKDTILNTKSWLLNEDNNTVNEIYHDSGLAALHVAAQSGDVQAVEDLIDRGADTNIKSKADDATPLHLAAKYNYAEVVTVLLRHGSSVTEVLTNGHTPLHVCCRRSNFDVIKILVETGKSDVNFRDKDNATPLHQATINGNLDICSFLVEHGADISASDINNTTPLMVAAHGGFLPVVQYFLTIGSNQSKTRISEYLSQADNEGSTALHLAVGSRHRAVAQFLLEQGAPINSKKTSNGYTALHQAAILGDSALVQMLIDKGALTEVRDNEHMTPLHRAALFNRVETIQIFIGQGVYLDIIDEDEFTPLICAAWKGQTSAGRLLLQNGADIKKVDKEMKSCLHWAVETQNTHFVKMLFEDHGGKRLLEELDRRELTPLHYASEVGNEELVKFLIEKGAKADCKDAVEKTPLHIASESGHLDCVVALYDACPGPLNDDDSDDMTPLLLASQNGHCDVVKYLIRAGADIDSRNGDRRSALFLAVENNHLEVISHLIDNSIKVNASDIDRNSPLHICAQVGHSEPVAILLESGADVTSENKYGKHPLDIAIEKKHEEVAKAILSSTSWENAMQMRDSNGLSPMEKLIEVLPDAAMQVLDQCVTKSHEDESDPDMVDYRYIDPGPDDVSYKKNKSRYFALETMVEYRREELLQHELSQNILVGKWKSYGAFCNQFDAFMYVLFLLADIFYLDRLDNIRSRRYISFDEDGDGCPVFNNITTSGNLTNEKLGFSIGVLNDLKDGGHIYIEDKFLVGIQFFILLFILYRVCREIPQIIKGPFKYIRKLESWVHWCLYITMVNFVWPPQSIPCNRNWAWGAMGVFFTWMNFIFIWQRFDYFGLYVSMFFTTLKSLMKAMTVYVFFIIGFGLAFYICFAEINPSFGDEWKAIITTFVMTLGEINKGDLLDTGESLHPFEKVSNLLVVTFLFLMPMVLINLTIGISVGDIDEIMRSSLLKRFKIQVDIIFGFEKIFPRWLQRRVWVPSAVHSPNKPKTSISARLKALVLGSAKTTSFLSKKVEIEATKASTIDDVIHLVNRHETTLTSLGTLMRHQNELLQRLAEKQGITTSFGVTSGRRGMKY